ncbi:MAG: helix-turn-helix domain-containing protein [Williamsia herbipolensis]|uniref:PucR C-terminal helix-turn-helix domain-containing protein n=1 Tax=Williamsia serinedens TaxID=391736 RepID=A0ABT1H4E1_9NOCA|nr:helix-turn-helix domain-containing protein [Williamsia serinedens]MBE7160555.1 helix-turn-helix domain-containing protein [Williamsia herbipolensis]MCP2162111.1 PucR C-terminal helix-turn-helix domain-containing protein [Williamsia serinedens]
MTSNSGAEESRTGGLTITVAGRPASRSLADINKLATQMVGHFADNVAPCHTLPGEQLHGDVTAVTQTCLRMAVDVLDQGTLPDEAQLAHLREAAAQWAREGVPLDTIIHTYHEGIKVGFDLIAAQASPDDFSELIPAFRLVMGLLDTFTVAVSTAYVEEHHLVAGQHHSATQTLMSALLAGHTASAVARQTGLPVAQNYQVVSMAIAPHPDELDPRVNTKIAARRKLRRVQSAIGSLFHGRALTLLSNKGGTVLIPADTDMPRLTSALLEEISATAEAPIIATQATGPTDTIPTLSEETHELMDLVRAIRRPPGLYQMQDLLIEYQITRPGPARDHLAATLAPLENHPELLETLRVHLETGLNRKGTGRRMHIHPNTVDYRLRRITQTTGIDLALPEGISRAHIALLALDLEQQAMRPSS